MNADTTETILSELRATIAEQERALADMKSHARTWERRAKTNLDVIDTLRRRIRDLERDRT